MITIPLYSPLKGYKAPSTKAEEVRFASIPGEYNAKRYERVKTPEAITKLVNDSMEEEEKEEQRSKATRRKAVDPFAFIDRNLGESMFQPLNLAHISPVQNIGSISFGESNRLSPHRSNYVSELSAIGGQSPSEHFHSHSHSRHIATRLGLTLSSDFRKPELFQGKLIRGKIESRLPSHALSPLRVNERPMTESEFTNSSPSFLRQSSLDFFGIGYEENNVDQALSRANMSTPLNVQQLIAVDKARKLAEEAQEAASEAAHAKRRNGRSRDNTGGGKSREKKSRSREKVKSSSQSNRIMSPDNVAIESKVQSGKQVTTVAGKSFLEAAPLSASPTGAFIGLGPSFSRQSSSSSGAGDKYEVGDNPGTGDHFARVHSNKFFLSENDQEHRTAKLLEKRAKLEARKAEASARNTQLLRQTSLKLTNSQKHRPNSKASSDTLGFYQLTLEQQVVLRQYIGDQAKQEFTKLFYAAMNDLTKYPNDEDVPAEKLENPMYIFVREQSKRRLAPKPLLIRKAENPRGIYLGGKGLGDENMLPVVAVIDLLPVVESIDFSDNRLTDVSLMPLAQKLINMTSLTHLNLSFNKIDESSETIMAYLRSDECLLRTLMLNGADVDDFECANLMNAIADNRTIENLGLSKNLLGKAEPYNTVYPDLTTGGEALGEMLCINRTMKALDVSWNAIRLASAETLGSSLAINSTLLYLDISHNAFGDFGTQALGFSLKTNKTLLDLNISYNSLVPRSSCVLTNALSYNSTLTMLNLDGNIIGRVGMQSLVAAIQRSAGENRVLRVSFEKCDCEKEDPDLFNPANPDGTWTVDLSKPYGRMVAEECMFLANYRAGCSITKLIYNGRQIKLTRKLDAADVGKFPPDEYHEMCIRTSNDVLSGRIREAAKNLSIILSRQFQFSMSVEVGIKVLNKLNEHWKAKMALNAGNPLADELHEVFLFEMFFAVFVINDTNNSKTMELDEFVETLEGLGKPNYDRDLLRRLMSEFDLDDSGTIDANEFSMIMVNHFCSTDPPRGLLVEASTGESWIIPDTGKAEFQVKYESELPKSSDIGADAGIDSVVFAMQDVASNAQKQTLFEQAINSPYFYLNADQAQLLYDEVLAYSKHKLDAMALILPQIVNSEQCLQFLDHNLDGFVDVNNWVVHMCLECFVAEYGKLELRVQLGPLFNAYCGVPTGHYLIDLEDPAALKGGMRLAATSVSESNYCRAVGTNTSQRGVHSSFRNEECCERPVEITGSWFSSCPKTGFVRFDFVSTHRPKMGTKAISDARFSRVLSKLALGEIEVERERLNRLGSLKSRGNNNSAGGLEGAELGVLPQFSSTRMQPSSLAVRSPSTSRNGSFSESSDSGASGSVSLPRISVGSPFGPSGGDGAPSPSPFMRRSLSGGSTGGKETPKSKKSAKGKSQKEKADLVKPPVTIVHLKEYFTEYMESCHHHLDILPNERKMTFNTDSNRCATPPDFSFGEKPSTTAMPPIFAIGYRKLLELQILLPSIYVSVKQFTEILQQFPSEGYLRVQLLQSVFSRLVDLENLWPVIDQIYTEDEVREVLHRLGILNIYDPMFPDRDYKLDLRRWDEREMAKILIVFAVAEPGENWIGEKFRWSKYDECVPGWCLPHKWTLEDSYDGENGPQTHGWLTLTYTSYGKDCLANMAARKLLRKRTLVGMKRAL